MPSSRRPAALLALLTGCFPGLEEVDLDTHDTEHADTDAGGSVTDTDTDVADDSDPGGDTGEDVTPLDELLTGALEVTEVHLLPADCSRAQGQYVELHNNHPRAVNLRGLRLVLGDETVTVSPSDDLILPTGEYALGVTSGADCPWSGDLTAAFTFPSADVLPTGGATVALKTPSDVILDSVAVKTLRLDGAAPTAPGHAVHRHNGVWCMADKLLPGSTADFGSPGAAATGCWTP